jgi:bifunctional UDP-N-acetylglucosamine pyrophosphorylase/glucosamine-1-phosphate N-acetyltransferase
MKAVILAAGEGSRMWPLAETRPKHLLPIAGKPLLGHVLTALAENAISDVTLVVGFQEDVIRKTLATGEEYGVRLNYVKQPRWTGTAAALGRAYNALGIDRFLAVYGDLMIDSIAVRILIEKAVSCPRVMGVVRMPDITQYGFVELRDERVTNIVEKPSKMRSKPGWINAGMYVLDGDVFKAIAKTRASQRAEYELTTSLQLLIKNGKEINAAIIPDSNWLDVGRPWDLLAANERALTTLRSRKLGTVEAGVTIKGPVLIEQGAVIKSGSYLEGPLYCGKGCKVGPHARIRPFTSLEADVVVGHSCDVKNSIIMKGSKVPHLSYVGDSIIGEHCNLGAGTMTANVRFDKRAIRVRIKHQLVDSGCEKLGVIMGDHVETGINTTLLPGVKIGSGTWIGPGAIVSEDVPSGRIILVKQKHEKKIRVVDQPIKHVALRSKS